MAGGGDSLSAGPAAESDGSANHVAGRDRLSAGRPHQHPQHDPSPSKTPSNQVKASYKTGSSSVKTQENPGKPNKNESNPIKPIEI